MSAGPYDPRPPVGPPVSDADNDPSIVPGLGPAPDEVPAPRQAMPTRRLDPSLDPDRFDSAAPVGPLDLSRDPDRYDPSQDVPPGQGQTLTELLGDGAFEEKRNNYEWAIGLAGILLFLLLVSWLFGSVISA